MMIEKIAQAFARRSGGFVPFKIFDELAKVSRSQRLAQGADWNRLNILIEMFEVIVRSKLFRIISFRAFRQREP
jgi:uncharacterized DUF497 family protein